MTYTIRNIAWLVAPEDDRRLHSPDGYTISIDADGVGEFVSIEDSNGLVAITRDAWPHIRQCIDAAFDDVADHP